MMLEASILGLKYHRELADKVARQDCAPLKSGYDYSFLISYGPFDDPDYAVVRKKTSVIDLTVGIEKVFAGFSPSCRNRVRKTHKIPGLKFHFPYKDFDAVYAFHRECEHERGWLPVPSDELRNSLVCCATLHTRLISAVSAYQSGKHLRVGRIFSKRRSSTVPASIFSCAARRIVFEICKYGANEGYDTLDLGGIDTSSEAKSGIAAFKLSFGGKTVPVTIGRFATPEFEAKKSKIRQMGLDVT